MAQTPSMRRLIEQLSRLPGIGEKTASRLAFHILRSDRDYARALADAFPSTPIVLNHTGLPADRSPEGIAGWRAAMTGLARAQNVAVKISGIGQLGKPWTADANREIVLTTIDLFGVDRSMFASNFPVDSLCGNFAEIFGGFAEIVADFSADEREALFARNAMRIYDIGGGHA
jgi:predicted TIM-barrel fold metal-dependent hydrolase